MVQAYNFIASWQLFPEKCQYENGTPPRSGNYQIESTGNETALQIKNNWVSLDNEAFHSIYTFIPDGKLQTFQHDLFSTICGEIVNSSCLQISFFRNEQLVLKVQKEIMPNGFLKVMQEFRKENDILYTNTDIYHKQLSVLPYASSVGSVAIRPTEEGMIKNKALQAMEEQTNMQLNQIRQQIELLAKQAQEIRKRKTLSMMLYESKLSFQPVIGQRYYLYQKQDESKVLSMIGPAEWSGPGPNSQFISAVKLLADHTWMEDEPDSY